MQIAITLRILREYILKSRVEPIQLVFIGNGSGFSKQYLVYVCSKRCKKNIIIHATVQTSTHNYSIKIALQLTVSID